MKEPIILEGEPFDWEEGVRQAEKHGGGNTIRGAMFSDPGIMACPGCDEHLWKEGVRVRCPHCGHEWKVASPGPLTVRALRSQIAKAEAVQPRTSLDPQRGPLQQLGNRVETLRDALGIEQRGAVVAHLVDHHVVGSALQVGRHLVGGGAHGGAVGRDRSG